MVNCKYYQKGACVSMSAPVRLFGRPKCIMVSPTDLRVACRIQERQSTKPSVERRVKEVWSDTYPSGLDTLDTTRRID